MDKKEKYNQTKEGRAQKVDKILEEVKSYEENLMYEKENTRKIIAFSKSQRYLRQLANRWGKKMRTKYLRCGKESSSLFCSYECKDIDSAEQAMIDAEEDEKMYYCRTCKLNHRIWWRN